MIIGIDCRVLSGQMCGITRYVANLVNAFSGIDNRNEYILFSDKEFICDVKLKDNFKKVILKSVSNLIWEQFELIEAISEHKIDVFHCPQNHGIPYRKKSKVVLTVHDIIPKIFPGFWKNRSKITRLMYDLSLNISIKKSDKIIADSENTKNDLTRTFCLQENKVLVIAPAIEERFKPIEQPIEVYKNKFGTEKGYILHLGGMGFNKNSTTVLSVFETLIKNDNLDCKLVIVGKKGVFTKDVLNKAEQLGEVVFTGYVPDEEMPLLYSGASVFLYPSLYEGFGLPVLEAMACGVPVVVSKDSSLPEIAGSAGLYVDPNNIEDICQKILLVLNDDRIRNQLVSRGLERVKDFSWVETAKQTLRVYEEVMN